MPINSTQVYKLHFFLRYDIVEPSQNALTTTVGVSIAVALLFSAVGFTVGVVTGICGRQKRQSTTPQISQGVTLSSVDTEVKAIPEYEEISLPGVKRVDIQLTDNAAYGCKS